MKSFDVELSSWILTDGNYEFVRFEVGSKVRFALEFYIKQYTVCFEDLSLQACDGRPSFYKSIAEIIYRNDAAWVLDFGVISAYREGPPKDLKVGQRVCSDLSLHVDPFHYYEELSKLQDIQPLIYEWELIGIDMDTMPLSQECEMEANQRFLPIDKIDTRRDRESGCNGSYILHCTLIDSQPQKTF